jgi:hypothetical protein
MRSEHDTVLVYQTGRNGGVIGLARGRSGAKARSIAYRRPESLSLHACRQVPFAMVGSQR